MSENWYKRFLSENGCKNARKLKHAWKCQKSEFKNTEKLIAISVLSLTRNKIIIFIKHVIKHFHSTKTSDISTLFVVHFLTFHFDQVIFWQLFASLKKNHEVFWHLNPILETLKNLIFFTLVIMMTHQGHFWHLYSDWPFMSSCFLESDFFSSQNLWPWIIASWLAQFYWLSPGLIWPSPIIPCLVCPAQVLEW